MAALSLMATATVTTGLRLAATSGADADQARINTPDRDDSESQLANTAAEAAVESPYFPARQDPPGSRPFPGESLAAVLNDGPNGDGRVVAISTLGGDRVASQQPRPEHRGYEELPPPPVDGLALAAVEVAAPSTASVAPAHPVEQLVTELSKLREDIQHFGDAAHGHSAVQAEMQSLRSQIAAINEQRRLDDLHHDVQRIAQRQDDLATQIETQNTPQVPVPPPAAVPVEVVPATPPAIEITAIEGESGQWSARLNAAEPAAVIRRLSELGRWNLVLKTGVAGPVSLSLESATAEELLQAVAAALDCAVIEEGPARIIVPAAQAPAQQAAAEHTIAKLLRPSFIAAADLLPLVRPMLTPGVGEVAITPDGPDATAIPPRAQGDALLVVDYPPVVEQITTMLAEVDVPPEEFVIEAVITAVHWNERTQHGIVPALEQQGVCSAPLRRDRGNLHSRPARSAQFRGNARDLLSAIQQIADVHVEATPSVHVLNRQEAQVEVGANVAYREQIAFGRRLRLVEEEIDFLPSRTELTVRPVLQGNDTVRLQVHPRVTHVHADPVSGLPREAVAELSTDVTIPLGSTAVIGGLTRSTNGSHPSAGAMSRLFGGRRGRSQPCFGEDHETIELVVMLTPRRACDVVATDALSPHLLPAEPSDPPPPSSPPYIEPAPAAFQGGQSHETSTQTPQPVDAPPLLQRLLGRRLDAPLESPMIARSTPTESPAPFPTVPPPEVEPANLTLLDDFGVDDALTTTEPPPFVMDLTTTTQLPLAPPEAAPAEIQPVVAEQVQLPLPPEPAAALAVTEVDPQYVPPPPPESAPQPIFRQHPAAYIPPEPTGRARRRNEREDRHETRTESRDDRSRNARRQAANGWLPPTPAR